MWCRGGELTVLPVYHISLASYANWLNSKCLNVHVSSCSKLLSTTSVIGSHTGFLSGQAQGGFDPFQKS